MGKVLHASGSGYFPYCLRNYPAEGVIIGPYQPLPMSLNAAMRVFWRIKRFRFYGTYTLDPFGRQEVRNWEMIFERNAESEENLVCNPDYNYVGGENIEEGGAFVLEPFTVQGSQFDTPPFLMNQILTFIQSQDVFAWVGALVALLSAVIAVASLIPGDEPEATLTKIVSFLSRFSKK
jgi:hypothetical protein